MNVPWLVICCAETLLVSTLLVATMAAEPTAPIAWRVDEAGRGTPAVHEGRVYFLSRRHELVAVDIATGDVVWRRATGGTAESTAGSTVLVASGVVIAADEDVVAFDVDGRERWRFGERRGDSPGIYLGSAAAGLIFAGSSSGHLYAVDARTGVERWATSIGDPGETTVFAPVAEGRDVVAGFSTFGARGDGGVVVVDTTTGRIRWRRSFPSNPVARGLAGGPAVTRDEVMAASRDGTIHVFDRRSGEPRWSWPSVGDGWFGSAATRLQDYRALRVAGSLLLAGSLSGAIVAYGVRDRRERWRVTPVDASVGVGIASDARTAYVPFYSGHLVAIDLASGRERWRTADVGSGFSWTPLVAGDAIFAAGTPGGLVAFRRE